MPFTRGMWPVPPRHPNGRLPRREAARAGARAAPLAPVIVTLAADCAGRRNRIGQDTLETTVEAAIPEGAACLPNMSAGARLRRQRIARASGGVALVAFGLAVAVRAPWWARALAVFVPAAVAAISRAEARNSVCVLRAADGTFESDDRSTTPMAPAALPAIRRAATSLGVKSVIVAAAAAAVAALTARMH